MAIAWLPPGSSFNIESWVLLALAVFIVVLRFLARIQVTGIRHLKLDDWGMKVAVTLFAFLLICARLTAFTTDIDPRVNPHNTQMALSPGLANNGMTDEYRAALDPASVEYQLRVVGSKLHLITWSLNTSTLWCLKLCIAVFYTRLTDGLSHMKIRIQIAYVALGVTYIVVMATVLGSCQPFNHYWQINPNPGDQCMPAVSTVARYVSVTLNVLTDLWLLHIPILMLWNAQISRIKKFFLIMLFSGGIFVIMAGILRVYFILTGGREGGAEAAYWGAREIFVAFVIGNAPVIYGGVRIWLQQLRNFKLYGRTRSRTKDRLGLDGFSALFSRATAGIGRKRPVLSSSSEKPAPTKKFAMPSYTETGNLNFSSDPSRFSPVPWGHGCAARRLGTNARTGDLSPAEMDSQFGIHVDVESVRSRENDPETVVEIGGGGGGGGKHYRTDSETPLGPFLLDSPPPPIHARISELPCEERQRHERRSVMFVPPQQNPTQRGAGAPDSPNLTKWISDDRSSTD